MVRCVICKVARPIPKDREDDVDAAGISQRPHQGAAELSGERRSTKDRQQGVQCIGGKSLALERSSVYTSPTQ